MLLQFSVENFRSIKDRAVLSMEASSDKEHSNNLVETNKEKVLKVASIFGANAAGKSNLFLALTAAIVTVKLSDKRQVGEPLFNIVPFMFDEESKNKPTEFEFVFIADGKKHVYGYSATAQRIITEYLYVYNSSRPSTIFERDENSDEVYKFTNATLKAKLKPLTERNTENKLFLATATAWNCEETRVPMMWLSNQINTYDTQYENLLSITGDMYEKDEDRSLRRFTNNILKEADINIADYRFESKDIPLDQLGQLGPVIIPKELGTAPEFKGKTYRIETLHNIEDENGNTSSYSLDMHNESKGTQSIFFLSPIIKRAFETGETLCIDEFDISLHPMLVSYLVKLFNTPEVNRANAQLIISSHTMTLLNLKELRRDQIYFIEKNQSTGTSELYSLDEFSPRTREDIRKAYLLGRYGSIPDIGEGDSLWE
ncbi:MAG: ATP-binding protein [Lachnospiraceae bacterium]|nr:ATP-binding protein [Lachnospiraceae bacterium]